MKPNFRAKILVLSDLATRGEREDRSGPAVRAILESHGWRVTALERLPDEFDQIRDRLKAWTDSDDCDAVFTSGGTGVGPRDVTPEATRSIIDTAIPGLAELMRAEGTKKTRLAALSRAVVGVRKHKLIVNLPGSPRGATESLESIIEVLPHAIDQIQGRTGHSE
jgi:molybdopterin adenylyltransferase